MVGLVTVGHDDDVGGDGAFGGGRGGVLRHRRMVTTGADGDGFLVDACEGLRGEFDVGLGEGIEPAVVDDAAFAEDFVVGSEDVVVFSGGGFAHV